LKEKDFHDFVKETADFFDNTDTHGPVWKDTNVKFERPEMAHVSIRIPKNDLVAIKKAANKIGVGYTTYIRMLLKKSISR
jgi:predicted DNA binding CopG/RHH family protein